jgi:hypothetical protein
VRANGARTRTLTRRVPDAQPSAECSAIASLDSNAIASRRACIAACTHNMWLT